DELAQLRKGDDIFRAPRYVVGRPAADQAPQLDVAPSGSLSPETQIDVEQRIDLAVDRQRAARRLVDAVEHLEQRALAGAVRADEAEAVARSELEAHAVEGADEAVPPLARDQAAGLRHAPVARPQRELLAHVIFEAEVFGANGDHQSSNT